MVGIETLHLSKRVAVKDAELGWSSQRPGTGEPTDDDVIIRDEGDDMIGLTVLHATSAEVAEDSSAPSRSRGRVSPAAAAARRRSAGDRAWQRPRRAGRSAIA